jgi:hypothetical protein
MVDCRSGKAVTALAAIAGLVAACASPEDPFTSGPAHAVVTGVVTGPAGGPIAASSVRIVCAGGGLAVLATTDSAGRYLASLATGSHPFAGGTSRLPCHFAEPAGATARAQMDTALGFVRGPVLVALQVVDLHER